MVACTAKTTQLESLMPGLGATSSRPPLPSVSGGNSSSFQLFFNQALANRGSGVSARPEPRTNSKSDSGAEAHSPTEPKEAEPKKSRAKLKELPLEMADGMQAPQVAAPQPLAPGESPSAQLAAETPSSEFALIHGEATITTVQLTQVVSGAPVTLGGPLSQAMNGLTSPVAGGPSTWQQMMQEMTSQPEDQLAAGMNLMDNRAGVLLAAQRGERFGAASGMPGSVPGTGSDTAGSTGAVSVGLFMQLQAAQMELRQQEGKLEQLADPTALAAGEGLTPQADPLGLSTPVIPPTPPAGNHSLGNQPPPSAMMWSSAAPTPTPPTTPPPGANATTPEGLAIAVDGVRSAGVGKGYQSPPPTKAVAVNSPSFGEELMEQVGRLRLVSKPGQSEQVRITLDPKELGELTVNVKVDHDQRVHINILAESEAAREAINRQLPQLREALAGQQLEFGEVMVRSSTDQESAGSGQWRQDGERQGENRWASSERGQPREPPPPPGHGWGRPPRGVSGLSVMV